VIQESGRIAIAKPTVVDELDNEECLPTAKNDPDLQAQ
jgi:hypothetical protein